MISCKKTKGFTLIELMIVVGVIGIVAAIAIPAYSGYIQTSRRVEGQQNLESINFAQTEFFAENNLYFSGNSTASLITNSQGLWTPAETLDADQNFTYTVVAGSTAAIASSFTATATGRGTPLYTVPTSVIISLGN